MNKPEYPYWTGLLIFLMSLFSQYAAAHRRLCICVILALAALGTGLSLWKKAEKSIQSVRMILPGMIAFTGIADLLFHHEILFFLFHFSAFLYGLFESVLFLYRNRGIWKRDFPADHISYVLRCVIICALCVCWAVLAFLGMKPEIIAEKTKGTVIRNTEEKFAGRYEIQRDIVYDDVYPEGTFDLIRSGEDKGLLVWLHGGSHTSGDKASEDNSRKLFENSLREGWSVASVNYALAPAYGYPVPLKQFDAFMKYCRKHLPQERIFFAGTGSGAEILIQYVTASLSEEYAERTGFSPAYALKPCGMYLASGLYTPADGADTGLILTDYTASAQLRSYYGKRDLQLNEAAKNADVIPYVTEDFPPVLLSEGNTGTYTAQAHRMAEALEKAGVLYEGMIFDRNADNKNLIYMSFDTQYSHYANAVHGRLISFLRSLSE